MDDSVNVIVCPNCGDTWIASNLEIVKHECLCFRCGYKYIPDKVYRMWRFVYNAIKTVKGH